MDPQTEDNARAWERAADLYLPQFEPDIQALRSGQTSLLPVEREILGDLGQCARAIHLQCSHGQDTLSLWLLGAREVVGLDISAGMLAHASAKSDRLAAPARWIRSDVLTPPEELDGTADLVYTGKGAVPWVMDLERWAAAIARLLRPGGRCYLFEQHPLTAMWDPEAADYVLLPRSYFFDGLRESDAIGEWADGRAARAVERGDPPCERPWTLGEIVTALAAAGLVVDRLTEHPVHFWDQFQAIPRERARRMPQTFSLLMHRPAARGS